MYYTGTAPFHPGGGDHLIRLTAAQQHALGQDAASLTERFAIVLDALAALRSGTWAEEADEAHTPDAVDWALAIAAIDDLETALEAVMAAAIREHVRHGASVTDLGQVLALARYQAQRRRERAIGVAERPVRPGPGESWARTGQNPPWAQRRADGDGDKPAE